MDDAQREMVAAGDLEKYAYCPLSWWLSEQEDVVDSHEGVRRHDTVGEELEEIRRDEEKRKQYTNIIIGLIGAASLLALVGVSLSDEYVQTEWQRYLFIAVALLWLLYSVYFLYRAEKIAIDVLRLRYEKTILFSSMGAMIIALVVILSALPANRDVAVFLEILALVWIVAANLYFYRSLNLSEGMLMRKMEYVSPQEDIAYVGMQQESPLLESRRLGIRGRPDYIIRRDSSYIPVEKKTGRTPKGPLFSHIVQLIAYCMLVQESFGPVPFGIIEYEEKKYSIDNSDELQDTVMELRDKLLRDREQDEAHRNHERKGKCIYCSRRDVCHERLA